MKLRSPVPNSYIYTKIAHRCLHECGNWKRGRTVSFLGISVADPDPNLDPDPPDPHVFGLLDPDPLVRGMDPDPDPALDPDPDPSIIKHIY
jgi:hypothetical protein